jgi:hypothetical protein
MPYPGYATSKFYHFETKTRENGKLVGDSLVWFLKNAERYLLV